MKMLLRNTALALLMMIPTVTYAQTITIRLGTVAPVDSPWYEVMNRMGQDWQRASNNTVKVQIFAGTLGDENQMLDKVKLRQIQGLGISGVGLERIAPGFAALQLPMLVDSFDDLDRVRNGLEPRLREAVEKAGYKVVNFSDVGWVHFFTKEKATTPSALKKMRLFINADDAASEKLYTDLGFKPVPLGVTDLLTSLKTGLIDAFDVPPLLALSDQSFGVAKHMIDVRWAPLVGATIIDKRVWDSIPAALQPQFERIARDAGASLRSKIRASGDDAITKMKQYGLIIETPNAAELSEWRAMAKTAREKLKERGLVPAADYDEAVLLSNDPISGAWTGDWGPTAAQRNQVRIDMKWDGKAVTGTVRSVGAQAADASFQNSSFNPATGVLHLEALVPRPRPNATAPAPPPIRHVIEGRIVSGSITGTWNPESSKGDFKLAKVEVKR